MQTFIVYLGEKPKSAILAIQFYKRIVNEILGKNGSDALLNTYTKSFSGFSVRMTEGHKNLMSSKTTKFEHNYMNIDFYKGVEKTEFILI